jgi:hypothetical protein
MGDPIAGYKLLTAVRIAQRGPVHIVHSGRGHR